VVSEVVSAVDVVVMTETMVVVVGVVVIEVGVVILEIGMVVAVAEIAMMTLHLLLVIGTAVEIDTVVVAVTGIAGLRVVADDLVVGLVHHLVIADQIGLTMVHPQGSVGEVVVVKEGGMLPEVLPEIGMIIGRGRVLIAGIPGMVVGELVVVVMSGMVGMVVGALIVTILGMEVVGTILEIVGMGVIEVATGEVVDEDLHAEVVTIEGIVPHQATDTKATDQGVVDADEADPLATKVLIRNCIDTRKDYRLTNFELWNVEFHYLFNERKHNDDTTQYNGYSVLTRNTT